MPADSGKYGRYQALIKINWKTTLWLSENCEIAHSTGDVIKSIHALTVKNSCPAAKLAKASNASWRVLISTQKIGMMSNLPYFLTAVGSFKRRARCPCGADGKQAKNRENQDGSHRFVIGTGRWTGVTLDGAQQNTEGANEQQKFRQTQKTYWQTNRGRQRTDKQQSKVKGSLEQNGRGLVQRVFALSVSRSVRQALLDDARLLCFPNQPLAPVADF
jgi:hypothetical protein